MTWMVTRIVIMMMMTMMMTMMIVMKLTSRLAKSLVFVSGSIFVVHIVHFTQNPIYAIQQEKGYPWDPNSRQDTILSTSTLKVTTSDEDTKV